MQVKPVVQPMAIQPLSQPQSGQAADDSHKMFQQLLDQMQNLLKPTDQNDPLAPVGVTPAQGNAADVQPSASAKTTSAAPEEKGGLLTQIEGLLGGDAKSAQKDAEKSSKDGAPPADSGGKSSKKDGGLAGLLTGKTSFNDTKAGKAISAIEGIGKLLALL